MSTAKAPLKVAVLDDYHSLSASYFSDLVESKSIELTTFTDTLPPSTAPDGASGPVLDRLKPFEVIVTMRERTPFPRALIEALAGKDGGKLRVLMTTGMRNLAIDHDACKQMGVILTGTQGKSLP